MSTGAKIFLLLLVVLAILFVVGMGMSIHHKTDTTNNTRNSFKASDHPVLESVQHALSLSSPQVKPVGNGCQGYAAKRLRIAASSSCGLKVAPSGKLWGLIPPADYRQVAFQVVQGKISFTPGPDDKANGGKEAQSHVWTAGDDKNDAGKLSVGSNGGTLVLQCSSPGGCLVQIQ